MAERILDENTREQSHRGEVEKEQLRGWEGRVHRRIAVWVGVQIGKGMRVILFSVRNIVVCVVCVCIAVVAVAGKISDPPSVSLGRVGEVGEVRNEFGGAQSTCDAASEVAEVYETLAWSGW